MIIRIVITHNVAVDRVSEELTADHRDAAGDGQGHGPLVEQLEGEIVNGDLEAIVEAVKCICQNVKLPLRCQGLLPWRS